MESDKTDPESEKATNFDSLSLSSIILYLFINYGAKTVLIIFYITSFDKNDPNPFFGASMIRWISDI